MDLIEKLPDECNVQTKISLSSCKFTSCKEATILCQSLRFVPTKFWQNQIFSGDELSICAKESYFLLTILNNVEIYLLLVCYPTKCLTRIGFATRPSL